MRRRNNRHLLRIESLESRRVLANITLVTTLADAGPGSLREAVATAAAINAGEGVVNFQAGLCGDVNLTSAISIVDPMTVVGPTSKCITINGHDPTTGIGDGSRVFTIDDNDFVSPELDVAISNLNISGGDVSGNGGGIYNAEKLDLDNVCVNGNHATGLGGGIYNWEELTVSNSIVSGNTSGIDGGGIYNEDTLEVTDSVVSGNAAADEGGGIYSQTAVTLTRVQISNNTAGDEGGGVYSRGMLTVSDSTITGNSASDDGGGIYNGGTGVVSGSTISGNMATDDAGGIDSIGSLTLTNSTVSGNTAGDDAGGIQSQGTLNVTNSTISGNRANEFGGGIYNLDGIGTVRHTTITGNIADDDGSGNGWGGGIATFRDATTNLTLANSIVAGNFEDATPNDVEVQSGTIDIATSNNNLIGDAGSAGGLTDGNAGNIVGNSGSGTIAIGSILDINLQSNGGPTATHLLVAGSPALNAGSAVSPPATDQRGFPRIISVIDIGSVEQVEVPSIESIVIDSGGVQRSMVREITVTFNSLVDIAANAFDVEKIATVITGTAIPAMGSAGVVVSQMDVGGQTVATLTFAGTGVEASGSLEDGKYELEVDASKVTTRGTTVPMAARPADEFFRLFGDMTGDGVTGIPDFGAFASAANSTSAEARYNEFLDFDGNGVISFIPDFQQWRNRFNVRIP